MTEVRINSTQEQGPEAVMPPVSAQHEVIISAKIIRKNGDVEDLGVISRTKQPIPKKLLEALKKGTARIVGAR